jgi:hypothetical protein
MDEIKGYFSVLGKISLSSGFPFLSRQVQASPPGIQLIHLKNLYLH